MNPINRKPAETPENIFYGVDVTNKAAVQQEFERLRKRHKNITILVIVVLIILGIIFFDFYRVNFSEGRPLFAIEEKVDSGTLFKGLGYQVLYCDNGDRHVGSVLYKKCGDIDINQFSTIVYDKMITYLKDEKRINEKKLDSLEIISLTLDGDNEEGGSDYLANIKYQCTDGSVTCFKTKKEFFNIENINLYVRINKFNEVYDVVHFKDKGVYYEQLVLDYTEKIKTYLIENEKLNVDTLKDFKIKLVDNHGRYKFRDNIYADSYLIEISYSCNDGTNTCVNAIDKKDMEGDYANLTFLASMFVDQDNNVVLVGPREYFDI